MNRLPCALLVAALLTARAEAEEANPACEIAAAVIQTADALQHNNNGIWVPVEGEAETPLPNEPVLGALRSDWRQWPCSWSTPGGFAPYSTRWAQSLKFSDPVYLDDKVGFVRLGEFGPNGAEAYRVYRVEKHDGRWLVTGHRFEGGGSGIEN